MRTFLKSLKNFLLFVAITILAPFILAKMNYWGESQAAGNFKFKEPYPPIQHTNPVTSYALAVERASPAVVSIHSTKEIALEQHPLLNDPFFRHFFGDPREGGNGFMPEPRPSIGSGVIVSPKGYILTNNHVVKDSDDIEVRLSDGRTAKAKVEGTDPDSDLAILKIELKNLPIIALGNSEDLKVGDVVLAIGNPFGVGQTVTQGIVSATHRSELGINNLENFIQTDAAINPGNSGGALIDIHGNCVGINNAIFTRTGGYQGIGFAIPIDLAKGVMGELIEHGHVTRGWLGITVSKLNDELRTVLKYPKGDGALIAGVVRGGPAHKAGLQPGDVIISVNDKKTTDPTQVLKTTSNLKPNEAYNIAIVRKGETHDFKVVVGKRPVSHANSTKLEKSQTHPKNPS